MIIHFFQKAASTILDLLYACLDHPRSVFAGLCHCTKFGFGAVVSTICKFLILRIRLEMPIHAPRIGFCGISPPLQQAASMWAQKACTERRHMTDRSL